MSFTLPDLYYDYDALEPYFDARTVEIHYTRHHADYLNKFNKAIENTPLENKTPVQIFNEVSIYPDIIRNNGGGYYNHLLFWQFLTPEKKEITNINLADSINKYFGTIQNMKREFSEVAVNHFGSGWIWLLKRNDGELIICPTSNQDNPLMDISNPKGTPILCLDIWEHAYYLKYRNNKEEYVQAFWNIVNWDRVAEIFNR